MIERTVEPTILRKNAEVAWRKPAQIPLSSADNRGPPCKTQYASPLCVSVMMVVHMAGPNFLAKMHDSLPQLSCLAGRLFTSQRERSLFWYVKKGALLALALVFVVPAHAQTVEEWSEEGPVARVALKWSLEDLEVALSQPEGRSMGEWQQPLVGDWLGVEVLDLREEWVPLEAELEEKLRSQWRPKSSQSWSWSVQRDQHKTWLRGAGSLVRRNSGAWERLLTVESVAGASPVGVQRVV